MRDPNSPNPFQRSVYVKNSVWESARRLSKATRKTISGWIVSLIEKAVSEEKKP